MENQQDSSRRKFIKQSAILTAAGMTISAMGGQVIAGITRPEEDIFKLPELPYAYDALEPHIDKMTMQIHHGKHHAGYATKLNEIFKGATGFDGAISLGMIFQTLSSISDDNSDPAHPSPYQVAIRNQGGGYYNHNMFWRLMKPNGGGSPTGKIAEVISASFDSFDNMKSKMNQAALNRFGSGWAWLVKDEAGKLQIGSTPNQDNPLMDICEFKGYPVLCLDVWEHAYYLKYQNKRADYLNAWWNLVNWDEVNRLYAEEIK